MAETVAVRTLWYERDWDGTTYTATRWDDYPRLERIHVRCEKPLPDPKGVGMAAVAEMEIDAILYDRGEPGLKRAVKARLRELVEHEYRKALGYDRYDSVLSNL